jgi:putative drug exporter of the RND superfamily
VISRLARLAVRRPWVPIACWLVFIAVFISLGRGVEDKMLPTTLVLKNTESGEWWDKSAPHFGENLAILIQGPKEALDRQGPRLSADLAVRENTRAMSAWSARGETAQKLRPSPDKAFIVVDVKLGPGDTVSSIIEPLEEFIDERIDPPVTSHLSGLDVVGKEQNEQLIESMHHAEMLAFPILIVVLLMVLRTPLAAAVPLFMGVTTVLSSFGVISVINEFRDLDAITLSMASMIGLALGVDYSLLIVSRFRESLEQGMSVPHAATLAANTAGRTANFAGCVLLAIMAVTYLLAPGTLMSSSVIGAVTVTILSMVGAMAVTPAVMRLAGHRLNAFWIGRRPGAEEAGPGMIKRFTDRLSHKPLIATAVVGGLMGLMAAPVLALDAIPPDPRQLPEGNHVLDDFNEVRRAGFGPEIALTVQTAEGTLLDPDKITRIIDFEKRLEALDYVKFVGGPAYLGQQTRELRDAPKAIARAKRELRDAQGELDYRSRQLHQARSRVARERRFLDEGVASGRRLLRTGSQLLAGVGSGLDQLDTLVRGLAAARDGSRQLAQGTATLRRNAERLAAALRQVRERVKKLLPQIEQAAEDIRDAQASLSLLRVPAQVTERELRNVFTGLNAMTVGKTDPLFAPTFRSAVTALAAASGTNPLTGGFPFPGYRGLEDALAQASAQASQAGDRVDTAVGQAGQGLDTMIQLADGAGRIANPGLKTIQQGQEELTRGLALAHRRVAAAQPQIERQVNQARGLFGEAQSLANEGIARGLSGFRELQAGLQEGSTRIDMVRDDLRQRAGPFSGLRQLERLERVSPNFFNTGYVPVAALAGARRPDARTATLLIDTRKGGNTGRIIILPDLPPNDPRTDKLVDDIRDVAYQFEDESGLDAPVGGTSAQLSDYKRVLMGRIPLLVIAISGVTYLLLVLILRSLFLPAIAVALNLITVGGGFGILILLFVDNPITGDWLPFGGSGSLDAIAVAGIFAITFALSIDYQVFLLTRMREEFVRTQSNEAAIDFGITKTAKIVTGAALIMIAVFSAFGLAEFITIKQFGIGLGVCVLIDATIIRLALLPSVMRLFGLNTWWIPNWLDERMPLLDVEGAEFEHEQEFMRPGGPAAAHA